MAPIYIHFLERMAPAVLSRSAGIRRGKIFNRWAAIAGLVCLLHFPVFKSLAQDEASSAPQKNSSVAHAHRPAPPGSEGLISVWQEDPEYRNLPSGLSQADKDDILRHDRMAQRAGGNGLRGQKIVPLPEAAVANVVIGLPAAAPAPVAPSPAAPEKIVPAKNSFFGAAGSFQRRACLFLLVIGVSLAFARLLEPDFLREGLEFIQSLKRWEVPEAMEEKWLELNQELNELPVAPYYPPTALGRSEVSTESLTSLACLPGGRTETAASRVKDCIGQMQYLLESLRMAAGEEQQQQLLNKLADHHQILRCVDHDPEFIPLSQMVCAFDLFIRKLLEKKSNLTSSAVHTLGQGIGALEDLAKPGLRPDLLKEHSFRFLVVDDESFSRYALAHALKRVFGGPEIAADGLSALKLASEMPYDLIFLDIEMPGMNGLELCQKIHETEKNRHTPVIFVTGVNNFDTRAQSFLCGGRDILAKPFLSLELTVKALAIVTHERLRGRGRAVETHAKSVVNEHYPAVLVSPSERVAAANAIPAAA